MSQSTQPTEPLNLVTIGWREWVSFPDLGISGIKAKIDTGARSSSLHTESYKIFRRDGARWVRFSTKPLCKRKHLILTCEAPLVDTRIVRNSGGHEEERPFIRTKVALGSMTWSIQMSLTCRKSMKFRLLLGRAAVAERCLIEPHRSYLASENLSKTYS